MRLFILMFYVVLQVSHVYGQGFNFEFAKSFGGTNNEYVYDMCVDSSDNIIIVGDFAGTVDFDPSAVVNAKTSTGPTDAYVAKYNSNGELVWVQTFGNYNYSYANGVDCDSNGNIYFTGRFTNNIDIDPSGNTYTLVTNSSFQQSYLTKLDSLGNFVWVDYNFTYWGSDATEISVNNSNEIIYNFVGQYLNPGNELRKISSTGQLIWTKYFNTSLVFYNIECSSNNDFAVTFNYSLGAPTNVITLYGNLTLNGSGGGILKLDNEGNFIFGLDFQNVYNQVIGSSFNNDGNLLVSGYLSNSIDIDIDPSLTSSYLVGSAGQTFLAQYSPTGNFIWGKTFNLLSANNSSTLILNSISIANNGSIILSGHFTGSVDIDPSPSSSVIVNTNYYAAVDLLILKLGANGNFIDFVQIGNNQNMTIPRKSFVNEQEEVFTVGFFSYTTNFNPDSVNSPQILTSAGGQDIFILKHATCTPLQWYLDMDNDGYGVGIPITTCWQPAGYVLVNGDYDDTNPNYNPGVTEICDNVDNNGDGNIDEGFDLDGDGHAWCAGDINDSNPLIYPGAPEICDGLDNNINGSIDEGYDLDGDGFTTCSGDINDNNPAIHPGAQELCDGLDNNQNDIVDEGFDLDADGYSTCQGDSNDSNPNVNPGAIETCNSIDDNSNGIVDEGFDLDLDGYSTCQGDCNDNDSSVNPITNDICNLQDDNCNGQIDEDSDLDGDGYTFCNGDCNDSNALINPNGTEVCNGIDDNCNTTIDDLEDSDNDGFTLCTGDCNDSDSNVNPQAPELCNSLDDNCDSSIDEGFDNDNDGYTSCQGDCDDNSLAVNPSAIEILDNSIDENCDGVVDVFVAENQIETISIYPNPAIDILHVNFTTVGIRSYEIYNAIGQLVIQGQLTNSLNNIDVSELSTEIFLLKVDTLTFRFIK
jgi:hypothetical protein